MTSSSPRAALSLLVVVTLSAGCASGGRSSQKPQTAPPAVTADDIDHNSGHTIEEVLQAKVPGLLITRTPNGVVLQIRGPATFMGGSEPLYVIDGVPTPPGPGGELTGLNPHDIESIKVLKNPADIAIYGVRGANGVILVTTKRPGTHGG
jgi:TonB-dependent SusC/RagA subfamily outer membrane receptor